MLAATAVGVSHLVYSTQAGGNYGFSLAWLIILIVFLKYPAFRFAVDYASASGHSLVTGYSKISRIALVWLAVGFFVDMFIATGAVALVASGLVISVLNLQYTGPQVAVVLTVFSATILLNGQYQRAERIVKTLVLVFSFLAIICTLYAIPMLGSDGRALFSELTPDRSLILFAIAMTGWMPMPSNGAILYSKWICEKKRLVGNEFNHNRALIDLKICYGLTLILALCFVLMGTAVLFETGREVPASAPGFASELFGIFTSVVGSWVYPIIAIAGIAVIWSTQFALMDACPRVVGKLFSILSGKSKVRFDDEACFEENEKNLYRRFLLIQVIGVTIMLLFLMGGFTKFLYFATSMGFLASPAVAYYNYRAITSEHISIEYRPSKVMLIWNWLGIIALSLFAIAFLFTTIF